MFRKELEKKLKSIFGFEKVTFDAPSDKFEQDTLFVEVDQDRTRVSPGKHATARVSGSFVVFAQVDKLPFGYFAKRVEQASAALTKDFFFSDLDENVTSSPARTRNICEIRGRFMYLYSAQYDPNQGSITGLNDGFEVRFAPIGIAEDDEDLNLLLLEDGNAQE